MVKRKSRIFRPEEIGISDGKPTRHTQAEIVCTLEDLTDIYEDENTVLKTLFTNSIY